MRVQSDGVTVGKHLRVKASMMAQRQGVEKKRIMLVRYAEDTYVLERIRLHWLAIGN